MASICLPTKCNLLKRNILIEDNLCTLCHEEAESTLHIFYHFNIFKSILFATVNIRIQHLKCENTFDPDCALNGGCRNANVHKNSSDYETEVLISNCLKRFHSYVKLLTSVGVSESWQVSPAVRRPSSSSLLDYPYSTYISFDGGFKNGVASWRFAGIDTHLDSIFADSDACFGARDAKESEPRAPHHALSHISHECFDHFMFIFYYINVVFYVRKRDCINWTNLCSCCVM